MPYDGKTGSVPTRVSDNIPAKLREIAEHRSQKTGERVTITRALAEIVDRELKRIRRAK